MKRCGFDVSALPSISISCYYIKEEFTCDYIWRSWIEGIEGAAGKGI
jgi:hypothetical protein